MKLCTKPMSGSTPREPPPCLNAGSTIRPARASRPARDRGWPIAHVAVSTMDLSAVWQESQANLEQGLAQGVPPVHTLSAPTVVRHSGCLCPSSSCCNTVCHQLPAGCNGSTSRHGREIPLTREVRDRPPEAEGSSLSQADAEQRYKRGRRDHLSQSCAGTRSQVGLHSHGPSLQAVRLAGGRWCLC